jgi:hypothetical protein
MIPGDRAKLAPLRRMTVVRYNKLIELANALRDEGLLKHRALLCDSIDGGQVYWPHARLYCYSIVADEDSDAIRELDGGYILTQIGEDNSEVCMTLSRVLQVIRDRLTAIQ